VKRPKNDGRTAGVVLDSGVFIALEKGDPVMTHLVERFNREATPLVTSAGVLAEIWRGGQGTQIPIVFLLRRTRVVDLTHAIARVLGLMLGTARTGDPIDAHVVLLARERGWSVLSSDAADLHAIDPTLRVEEI
jgi:PIN domain